MQNSIHCCSAGYCYVCVGVYLCECSTCMNEADSDSDVFTAGPVTGYLEGASYTYYDNCQKGNLQEQTCGGDEASDTTVSCPGNSYCSGGACVCDDEYELDDGPAFLHAEKQAVNAVLAIHAMMKIIIVVMVIAVMLETFGVRDASCTDEGDDKFTQESVYGYDSSGSFYSLSDTCANPVLLYERSCSGATATGKVVSCGSNSGCSGGACVCDSGYHVSGSTCVPDASCSDSDGGKDVYTSGTVSGYTSSGSSYSSTDSCFHGSFTVLEHFCSGDSMSSERIICGSNSQCSGGVCVCNEGYELEDGACVASCSSDNCGGCGDVTACLSAGCDWDGSSCAELSDECTLKDFRWPGQGDWCCIDPYGNGVSTQMSDPLSNHISYY